MTEMFDVQVISSPVRIGNGKALTATKIGKMRRTIIQKNGDTVAITLTEVKYIEDLWVNLFSIGKGLQNAFNIGNKGINIFLTKGKTAITFDKIMRTNKWFILGVDILPSTRKSCVATMMLDRGKNIPKPILHGLLAHASNDSARKTAHLYGWKTTGDPNACEDCDTAKARQKNLKKTTETKSNLAGERLMIDISSIKGESFGGSKYWLLILDDCTDQCWSKFLTAKSHTAKVLVPFIKEQKNKHDKTVKYIRCDNAGENKATNTACAKKGLGIQFKYTAPVTPQQNGRVEPKFATLYDRV
jgi:hypothetical protein